MELIDWIQKEIATNQFFSAALGGSVFYSVFGYIRSIASSLWHRFVNLFIREITVSSYSSSEVYNQLLDFVSSRIKHPKNIQINERHTKEGIKDPYADDEDEEKSLRTSISYGGHWFWYNWYTYVYVYIKTEEHHAQEKSDIINIRIYSPFSRTLRKEISGMFISSYTERGNISTCYEIGQYGPVSMGANTRKLESVFIDSASKNKILESVYSLDHKKEIYQRAGINRTLGVMLFGPPGTGKTSFILGLANELNRSVYYVDFSTQTEQKATYLKRMKPNSFLVLEDIDTIPSFKVRDDSKAEHQKDLGKLLKILDGAQLPDNTIIFATTNYIDRIDPAVKRFGRFDVHCELGHANKELAAEMVNYIDSSKLSILDQLTFPVSQAEIQARVLKSVIGSESEYTPIVEDEDTPEEDTEKVASMEYGPVSLRQIIRRRRMGRT